MLLYILQPQLKEPSSTSALQRSIQIQTIVQSQILWLNNTATFRRIVPIQEYQSALGSNTLYSLPGVPDRGLWFWGYYIGSLSQASLVKHTFQVVFKPRSDPQYGTNGPILD